MSGFSTPAKPWSSILIDIGERILALFFERLFLCGFSHFHLYSFSRSKHLALYVEAASFLRVVHVEQLLETFHDSLNIGFASFRWRHIQYLARFVERDARGRESASAATTIRFICLGNLLSR